MYLPILVNKNIKIKAPVKKIAKKGAAGGKKRRRRKPVARALQAAAALRPTEDKTVERGSVSLDNLAKEAGSRDDAMRPEAS